MNPNLNSHRASIDGPREHARVLVAEDDEEFRLMIAERLVTDGYEVIEAHSGTELLTTLNAIEADQFPSEGVDLILLDHLMPGLTGLEVLKRLRGSYCDVPVILMTAFAEPIMEAEAKRLHVPLLSKPFDLDTLCDVAIVAMLSHPIAHPTWVRP